MTIFLPGGMAPVGQRDGISAPMAAMFMPRTLHEFTVIECRPGMHRLAASAREPARATVADQPIKGNLMIRSSAALFVAVTFILFEAGMSGTEAKENAYSVLYSFCSRSGCADGAGPQGNLVIDKRAISTERPGMAEIMRMGSSLESGNRAPRKPFILSRAERRAVFR
jgi:hypothetical protein